MKPFAYVNPANEKDAVAALSKDYEKALPGYTCHLMPRGLFLLSRWPVKMVVRGKLDSLGAFASFDVELQHARLGRIENLSRGGLFVSQ